MRAKPGENGQNSLPLYPSASPLSLPGNNSPPVYTGGNIARREAGAGEGVGMSVTDPSLPIDESTNRRVIEAQMIENHLRSLTHLLRRLDSGLAEPDAQQVHVLILEALTSIEDVLPFLFEALDMDGPYRVDMGRRVTMA